MVKEVFPYRQRGMGCEEIPTIGRAFKRSGFT